jgi:hypothetical protein
MIMFAAAQQLFGLVDPLDTGAQDFSGPRQ